MAETQEVRDKVVLVGLNSPVLKKEENADEDTMEELSALVETAGGETVGIVLQNRPSPDPRTFIGEGKVAEVQLYCENTGATMVIFDNDLSPSQMRVLTELLGVQVLDRCGLILDIFAQRAKTKEGRLQDEEVISKKSPFLRMRIFGGDRGTRTLDLTDVNRAL